MKFARCYAQKIESVLRSASEIDTTTTLVNGRSVETPHRPHRPTWGGHIQE